MGPLQRRGDVDIDKLREYVGNTKRFDMTPRFSNMPEDATDPSVFHIQEPAAPEFQMPALTGDTAYDIPAVLKAKAPSLFHSMFGNATDLTPQQEQLWRKALTDERTRLSKELNARATLQRASAAEAAKHQRAMELARQKGINAVATAKAKSRTNLSEHKYADEQAVRTFISEAQAAGFDNITKQQWNNKAVTGEISVKDEEKLKKIAAAYGLELIGGPRGKDYVITGVKQASAPLQRSPQAGKQPAAKQGKPSFVNPVEPAPAIAPEADPWSPGETEPVSSEVPPDILKEFPDAQMRNINGQMFPTTLVGGKPKIIDPIPPPSTRSKTAGGDSAQVDPWSPGVLRPTASLRRPELARGGRGIGMDFGGIHEQDPTIAALIEELIPKNTNRRGRELSRRDIARG